MVGIYQRTTSRTLAVVCEHGDLPERMFWAQTGPDSNEGSTMKVQVEEDPLGRICLSSGTNRNCAGDPHAQWRHPARCSSLPRVATGVTDWRSFAFNTARPRALVLPAGPRRHSQVYGTTTRHLPTVSGWVHRGRPSPTESTAPVAVIVVLTLDPLPTRRCPTRPPHTRRAPFRRCSPWGSSGEAGGCLSLGYGQG